jgi:hypothetical protein
VKGCGRPVEGGGGTRARGGGGSALGGRGAGEGEYAQRRGGVDGPADEGQFRAGRGGEGDGGWKDG